MLLACALLAAGCPGGAAYEDASSTTSSSTHVDYSYGAARDSSLPPGQDLQPPSALDSRSKGGPTHRDHGGPKGPRGRVDTGSAGDTSTSAGDTGTSDAATD